jgi:hypothetical protein
VGVPPTEPGAAGNGHAPAPHGAVARPPASGFPWPGSAAPLTRRRAKASLGFRVWAVAWSRPWAYRLSLRVGRLGCRVLDRRRTGWLRRVPMPGTSGWTDTRDIPALAPRSFRDEWAARS